MKTTFGITSLLLIVIVATLTYIAINAPMTISEAGLLVFGFFVFGLAALATITGFIASFFEEKQF